MRLVRKLTLLAILAIAATALMAPMASAQEPLIHDQDPGLQAWMEPGGPNDPCPEVVVLVAGGTAGGCILHITGTNIGFVSHMAGGVEAINSTCTVEVVARVDANVEGFLTHAEMTTGAVGECHRVPCGFVVGGFEGRPWAFYAKEVNVGVEALTALLCIQTPTGVQLHCEVDFRLVQPTNHRYGLNVPVGGATCHGATREITGTWGVEADPGQTGEAEAEEQVEINHTL